MSKNRHDHGTGARFSALLLFVFLLTFCGSVFALQSRIRTIEEEDENKETKYRLAFAIGGDAPLRDLSTPYNVGTLMELTLGYHLYPFLQIEGGLGYTTGFLEGEGVIGFDYGTGRVVELRGNYIMLPIGLKFLKSFNENNLFLSAGGGVLYNRYAQSLSLVDIYGLASQRTESRSGGGFYFNTAIDHFFTESYGITARVRYVKVRTSGENVGNVLGQEPGDYDPESKGTTDDAWLGITGGLVYRF